jgi:hypothetical protein
MPSRLALKFLTPDATGPYSKFEWPLPNGKPGRWVKVAGKLVACENGIHACTPEQAPRWFDGRAFLIELDGRVLNEKGKLYARKGRLVRELDWNPRLYAADCAERVLPIFEKERPDDDRPRKAIEAARAYERGEIDAAAWAAARDAAFISSRIAARIAAEAAASAAARIAARIAVWDAASAAAWDAARIAAWDAASDAAGAAAGEAERTWQTSHLLDSLSLTPEERTELVPTEREA